MFELCICCLAYASVYFPTSDDEPEGPEDVPEHEQRMKCARVIRTNYSLLYGHLDAGGLLPKLPEKDLVNDTQFTAAKSYQQRFAKNAVVIDALLKFDRPSHGLLKFCDTLETTRGQEHIGRKLLKGIKLLEHLETYCSTLKGKNKNLPITHQGSYVTHGAIWHNVWKNTRSIIYVRSRSSQNGAN